MAAMGPTTWITTSAALHGAVLWVILVTPVPEPPPAETAPDVWQGGAVAVELGGPAPPEVAPETTDPEPEPPPRPKGVVVPPPASRAAPAPRNAPHSAKPAKAPAKPAPAKAPRPPPPKPQPAPAKPDPDEDWLGESGSVEEVSEPKQPPRVDPFLARLAAAERRKAAEREAARARQARADSPAGPRAKASAPAAAPKAPPAGADPSSSLPANVRNLAVAVTRAIPYATQAHPDWRSLPLGTVGRFTLTLRLKDGRLLPNDPAEPGVPAALRHLEKSTLALLRGGRFAIPKPAGTASQEGEQRFEITVRLSQEASRDALAIGFRPPKSGEPGNAFFILPSGRRFDAAVDPKN